MSNLTLSNKNQWKNFPILKRIAKLNSINIIIIGIDLSYDYELIWEND